MQELTEIKELQNALPELKNWENKQHEIVKENPYIEIVDNETYKIAKQRRTNLVSGRTDIQKQDKILASKLKSIRSGFSSIAKELIEISLPLETKQQIEVKRYEQEKEREKQEKQRIEQERIDAIKSNINDIKVFWLEKISQLLFVEIDSFLMDDVLADTDTSVFQEFQRDYFEMVSLLNVELSNKIEQLKESESQRIEKERLKAEREALEAEKEKQRKIEAQIKAEQEERERKIREEREALEAEKNKIAEQEAKKKAEQEEEKKRVEAENRILALAPDKEKAIRFIKSIQFTESEPELENEDIEVFLVKCVNELEAMKVELIASLDKLK